MVNIVIALVLSFFIAGLGLVYEGKVTLGSGVILLWTMLCLIALYAEGIISIIAGASAAMVWVCSFVTTFLKVH